MINKQFCKVNIMAKGLIYKENIYLLISKYGLFLLNKGTYFLQEFIRKRRPPYVDIPHFSSSIHSHYISLHFPSPRSSATEFSEQDPDHGSGGAKQHQTKG